MHPTRATVLAAMLWSLTASAIQAQPVRSGWVLNPSRGQAASAELSRSLPEVHSVEIVGGNAIVRSAGISIHNLAPFQTPPTPVERRRRFEFRIPDQPRPAATQPTSVRPDMLGVFLNGQPIYNYFDAASYQGRNIWRDDLIARNDDGTVTAGGAPRPGLDHKIQLRLLEGLIAGSGSHSPVLGFAFDGSPVYGPWGFTNPNGSGGVRRMRSSYRLRSIQTRTHWPGGIELTPAQTGPAVGPDYPLGSFVEDYELTVGSGDLDRFNGRLAVTPEYPGGVYAYFLSTDEHGRLAFPYFIADAYHGQISPEELDSAAIDLEVAASGADIRLAARSALQQDARLKLEAGPTPIVAGEPARLSFQALDETGAAVRSLEYVHEKPIHLLVVSEDLSRFDHIHPELRAGSRYVVSHVFPVGGTYRIYADYTPPGASQRVEQFQIEVAGAPGAAEPLRETSQSRTHGPIRVELTANSPLVTGAHIELVFKVRDAETGTRIPDMEPFLGAWGHFVLIREGHTGFIHAHPFEKGQGSLTGSIGHSHIHGAGSQALAPPPSKIRVQTAFENPGLYKLWAQFGLPDQVATVPFVLRVAASTPHISERPAIPESAIVVRIGANGFEPSRVSIEPGRPALLAFVRSAEPNCGSKVVFPALSLEKEVPLGEVAIVELPVGAAGELTFACGMGMYRGSVLVTGLPDEQNTANRR